VTKESWRNLFLAGIIVVIFTLGLRAIAPDSVSAPDFDGRNPKGEVVISVARGDAGSEIAKKLFEAGVVKSSEAFFRIAVIDQRSTRIAPGEHRIQGNISASQALEQMLDPSRIANLIVVRDGAWQSEIVNQFVSAGFSPKSIEAAIKATQVPSNFKATNLEGFLYPAFYSFATGETPKDLINEMLKRFAFSTKEIDWNARSGFTPYEILTIASLIETEGTPDVHRKVSRVIYNRLVARMPLQLDSTVHYILQRRGEIQVSLDETKLNSPYNTFVRQGLPPTPIGSPTLASIEAALDPEPGDWLYFVTVKPGETRFTSQYQEFLSFKALYKKNLAAGLFK